MNKSALLFGVTLLAAAPLAAQPTGGDAAGTAGQVGQPAAGAAASASTSAKPDVAVGATVNDTSGGAVGKITEVAGGNATIDTGTVKAAVPVTSFGAGQNGALVLAMTKAQLESAAAQTKPAEVTVGANVVGPQGNPVGKVAAVSGDLVTVETPKTKVQLPKNAFAAKGSDLAIGMTQDQLEAAAAKAAGGQTPGD